ncbi:MAG TPA: response regulator [Verrucomicrobiae bacterium]|nr:response regulator [Verrucomicrobiae bacterium]
MTQSNQLIEILMAEDSPDDRIIAEEAIKSSKLLNRVHTVGDGEEALEFLRREGRYKNAPVPDLILLDVNMPRKTGLEALAEIKNHPQWKYIPVVILTSSQADRDIFTAYGHHANCYIVKPVDFERFVEVVKSIENFWFGVVKLPPKRE